MKYITLSIKKVILFTISILLISSPILGTRVSASSADNGESCLNTVITKVSAIASDQNFPASAVLDMDPQSIWSTYGKGAWIEMDLGEVKNVCSVDIRWYKGDQRWNNFIISISTDGSSYQNVIDSKSSGNTASFERYKFPDISARYIKITVNGNTQNNYASIADIMVNINEDSSTGPNKISATASSQDCVKTKISKVTASGNKKTYLPSNAIDNNSQTRWVNEKKDSWIKLDLGKTQTICEVDIQWFKGDLRVYSFTVSVSKDNKKFIDVAKQKSSGNTNGIESYSLKEVDARYVRITVTKNTENNFASIVEIAIGSKKSSNPSPPPSSDKCDSNLPISAVTASGSQSGNPASGATDNDQNTRWSNQGFGSWIRLDLGGVKKICSLGIAWYRGNERTNTFEIATSSDGSTFTTIGSEKSKGTSSALEKYDISDSQARYVQIKVTGNSLNDWISISEIDVIGSPIQPPPADNIPPTVVGSTPANGDTGIPVTSSITATFSEPVQSWSSPTIFTVKNGAGTSIPGTLTLSTDRKTVTFSHSSPLSSSTSYIVTVTTGVKDLAGNAMTVNKVWSFTTADTTPPTVTSTNPANSATDIAVTSSITATFNEAVQSSTLSMTTFKIQAGTTSIPGTVTLSADGKTAMFDPTSLLAASISYTVTITTGVKDLAGNPMVTAKTWSFTTAAPSPPPPPPPIPGTDGIKEIYPTAPGSDTWFFNPENPEDGQFDPNGAAISKNVDGSWHLDPGTTRMLVFPKSAGLLSDDARGNLPTYDFSELAQIGHWYKPTDWKNTEMTGYFKVSSTKSGDGISFVTRSVRHNEAIQNGCGGSSYHNNIRFEGTFQYKKEQWHVNYDTLSPSKNGIGSIMNKWVGFKGIVYNLPNGNVKLESYVDKDNNNQWQKVQELIDSGNWGDDMTHCNADKPGAQITWGSPMIIFKSTGVTYDFKKLSIRNIIPPT